MTTFDLDVDTEQVCSAADALRTSAHLAEEPARLARAMPAMNRGSRGSAAVREAEYWAATRTEQALLCCDLIERALIDRAHKLDRAAQMFGRAEAHCTAGH